MTKRALLINPPTGFYIREDRCQCEISKIRPVAMRPPIDLLYMAATLEQVGVKCKIKDYPIEKQGWGALKRDIAELQPGFVFISTTTPSFNQDMRVCDIIKNFDSRILTIAKGPHLSVLDDEVMKKYRNLDIAIRGECELSAQEIVTNHDLYKVRGITFRDGRVIARTENRLFLEDLDSLPFPARHLLNNRLYIRPDTGQPQTTIITNRGCNRECIYCLAKIASGTKLRFRSPENIIDEIKECIDKYNINNFLLRGESFTIDKQWAIEVCRQIISQGLRINWCCSSSVDTIDEELLKWMKKSGCWLIGFGIESGSQEMLNRMKKFTTLEQAREAVRLCKKIKIKTSLYFLLGLPWETEETFELNRKFALELDGDFILVIFPYPFPGTEYFNIVQCSGLLKQGSFPADSYAQPVVSTRQLSIKRLLVMKRRLLMNFYIRPKYIIRTLLHNNSLKTAINYTRYGLLQLADLLKE
ncbi:MAG: radical SAM protein [Candidatus Omnitrophota bacterium]|jgi:radical SAM superfamily enzyme YgiQ (UPF0313 family)